MSRFFVSILGLLFFLGTTSFSSKVVNHANRPSYGAFWGITVDNNSDFEQGVDLCFYSTTGCDPLRFHDYLPHSSQSKTQYFCNPGDIEVRYGVNTDAHPKRLIWDFYMDGETTPTYSFTHDNWDTNDFYISNTGNGMHIHLVIHEE